MDLGILFDYLDEAFNYINKVQGLECVIAFGNTGCGKSTMFNSLCFGADKMKEIDKFVKITKQKGGVEEVMEKKVKIIDIDQTKVQQHKIAKIGHQNN